jgi:ligand-binding SRPBCC domain-containing protein
MNHALTHEGFYVRPASVRTTHYSRSIEIECPVEKAFAFCFSIEGFKAHFPHPVKDYAGPPEWRKGDTAFFRYKQVFWTGWKVQFVEVKENEMFCDVMIDGYMKVFEHTHKFERLGPNRTRYTDSIEFASGFGRFIDRFIGVYMVNSLFTKRHAMLKPALER